MIEKSWTELLEAHSQELAQGHQEDMAFLEAESALPVWVKYLMAMQLDAVANKPGGARFYGNNARAAGATKEQVIEAIKLLRMFAGRPAMVTGVEALRDL